MAPPESQSSCRHTDVRPTPNHARLGAPPWVIEYMALMDDDYLDCAGSSSERHAARYMQRRCGEDMDLRSFGKIGPDGELLGYRNFPVCMASCRCWIEF